MRTLMVAALIFAAPAAGCVVHDHGPYHRHYDYGPAVVVETGHVHSDHCGHYHHDGSWYYSEGHHHGPGCGHAYRGGMWIVVR
jgi:hypothetical protein